MDRILAYLIVGALFGTLYGGYQCIEGHTYSVAARHEATTVGRVVGISSQRGGGPEYHYVFSVNGVEMNDYSNVCATPLAPGACYHKGPVQVYYSYQPFSNSRLQDFAISSADDYRFGIPALAIALPLLVLSCAGMAVLMRKDKNEEGSDPSFDEGISEVPDDIHIAPRG